MKPADRALDLVVVGLGQAGGNLAAEFARLGYRAIALNTAHTDLSALGPGNSSTSLPAEQRMYVGIDGYDGAGADLNYGRECIHENAERIRTAVAAHSEGADVVILTAGLGGGTGSSVSELVRVLKELELPIITLTTLPNEYESGIAKVNAVRAVSDLVKLDGIGWIFADNTRLSHTHGGVSLDKYFEIVNQVIVHPLDALNRLNSRPGVHPIRTIDGEDLRSLLLAPGVMNYSETKVPALTVETVVESVRESLQSSPTMPVGFSAEEVSYMGVILEASEEVLSSTPFSFYEQLNEQLKDETGGGAVYMGVYRTEKPVEDGAAVLRLVCSTKSLPEGVQAIVNDARREGGTLRDKLQRSISTLDLGEIEDFDLFKTSTRSTGGGGRRRGQHRAHDLEVPELSPRAAVARPASVPAPVVPEPPQVAIASEPDTMAPAGEEFVSMPPLAEGEVDRKAEAASYAKLVATFLRTEFESTKRRVARRLDAARRSEDEQTRTFAEKAIERIGKEGQMEAFEAALTENSTADKPAPTA